MGLDNLPVVYPCLRDDTAVYKIVFHDRMPAPEGNVHGMDWYCTCGLAGTGSFDLHVEYASVPRIDCAATASNGGCPYKNAAPPPATRPVSELGPDCWYRGKQGMWLLETYLGMDGSFLRGQGSSGGFEAVLLANISLPYVPPSECRAAAADIEWRLMKLTDEEIEAVDGFYTPAMVREAIGYLAWYLRWVADECEGVKAWA